MGQSHSQRAAVETDRRGVWVNFVNWDRAVRHAAAEALLAGERLGQARMRLWIKVNPVFKQGEREERERGGQAGWRSVCVWVQAVHTTRSSL